MLPSVPKILFLDIETFPNVAYVWGMYEQNVIRFKQQSCIASFAAKWLGKPIFAKSLPDYAGYKAGSYDDKGIVEDLWKLLDEADVVVAHNGNSFDIKVVQGRIIFHQIKPPSPFKSVDTKLATKAVARFNSNKLDDLGSLFGLGKKIKTDFDLWEGCINGDQRLWDRMVRYNKRDVILLEKVYLRLLPWMNHHPNVTSYDEQAKCPKCGSRKIQYRGTQITTTCSYNRFQCQDCGGWGRSVKRVSHSLITHA